MKRHFFFAKIAKAERQPTIYKARDLIENVQKYNNKNFFIFHFFLNTITKR